MSLIFSPYIEAVLALDQIASRVVARPRRTAPGNLELALNLPHGRYVFPNEAPSTLRARFATTPLGRRSVLWTSFRTGRLRMACGDGAHHAARGTGTLEKESHPLFEEWTT